MERENGQMPGAEPVKVEVEKPGELNPDVITEQVADISTEILADQLTMNNFYWNLPVKADEGEDFGGNCGYYRILQKQLLEFDEPLDESIKKRSELFIKIDELLAGECKDVNLNIVYNLLNTVKELRKELHNKDNHLSDDFRLLLMRTVIILRIASEDILKPLFEALMKAGFDREFLMS